MFMITRDYRDLSREASTSELTERAETDPGYGTNRHGLIRDMACDVAGILAFGAVFTHAISGSRYQRMSDAIDRFAAAGHKETQQ